jgi:hypothetical protein
MAIKFLSGLNLSNVTAGSILKLDSNGNIVAAVAGTDYSTSAGLWSTAGTGGVNINKDVRIGTYSSDVLPEARLHVYDYQTTDPKLLIEDGNTGDASMQFKISTQSYTMGIDNSDSDKFVLAASTALGTTNVLEISTTGLAAFQKQVLFNEPVSVLGTHGHWRVNGYGGMYFNNDSDTNNTRYIHPRSNGALSIGRGLTSALTGSAPDNYFGTSYDQFYIKGDGLVGIGTSDPTAKLDVRGSLYLEKSLGDNTFITLSNKNTASDIGNQKSFIDFTFTDSNTNETPQVRIGAHVGNNDGDASTQEEEGMGAFVVHTNNADTAAGAAGTSLTERFRVDRLGNVGIGTNNPAQKLHVVGDIYTTSDFRGNSIISASAALTISNTGIQPDQGEVEDIVAFNFATTKVSHIDTDGYIHAVGFKTNTAATGFLKADGSVDTSTYLTSYTEADTLDSVTGRGATTTNNISVGNLTAVGGTFTDPVTIYDSTTTENPRLSVGRNAGESIQFGVTDVVNTITAKQDSDSNGDHFFVLDRVFAGTGDSTFRIQNDGTPDLTIDGSGVVSLNQYNTAGILKVNTSGTISVDTNTYSTATGVADNADNYSSWTVSDGTNTESITSGTTDA